MTQPDQITIYGGWSSPYCQRVYMALHEAKVEYTTQDLDVHNRPSWFAEVNPIGKIPAMTFGGPKVSPDEPSSESAKLYESGVILQFIAEKYPESKLLPADLVKRAHARIFMQIIDDQWISGFRAFIFGKASYEPLLKTIELLQGLLPETGFAVGDFSVADMAIAPFLPLFLLLCKHELGKFRLGEGQKALEEFASPRFARMRKYVEDIEQRPSFKAVFDEEKETACWKAYPLGERNQ